MTTVQTFDADLDNKIKKNELQRLDQRLKDDTDSELFYVLGECDDGRKWGMRPMGNRKASYYELWQEKNDIPWRREYTDDYARIEERL